MKNSCPDCGSTLGPSAYKCKCGWKQITPDVPKHVDCCFVGCQKQGMVKLWTATGWAVTCLEHYRDVKPAPRVCRNQLCEEIGAAMKARAA